MKLEQGDTVITAWAEYANGPGWSNQLIWVLVQAAAGKYRLEALQSEEQTPRMRALFGVCAEASTSLTGIVERVLRARAREESP